MNFAPLERASGRSWPEWVAHFEANDAKSLDHAQIAKLARDFMPDGVKNPDWWAQGAAIAYEHQVGMRVPGQAHDGTFRVSVSRTLPIDRDAAIALWVDTYGDRDQLGHAVSGLRTSRTDKRSFARFSLDGAGKVEIAATPKADKTSLAVNHTGLAEGVRLEEWRAHWKGLLADLHG